jgi:peptidoglycan/LPS O-acetylase OafA/YrhL
LIFYLHPKRAAILAGIYVALSPIIRFLVWQQHRDWLDIDFASITQMSSIATGCVLAYVLFHYDHALPRLLNNHTAIALTILSVMALIATAALNHLSGKYYIIFGDPIASLLITACILSIWFNPDGLLHRLLNTPPLVAVGVLSYSIYLWQQPFTGVSSAVNWSSRWPQNLLFIFAAATASYFIIERPFLKLKTRFSASDNRSTDFRGFN